MWVTKLLISPVKKGFFAQKRPNFAQNWRFCPLLAHLVLGRLVVVARGLYLARHLFTLSLLFVVLDMAELRAYMSCQFCIAPLLLQMSLTSSPFIMGGGGEVGKIREKFYPGFPFKV